MFSIIDVESTNGDPIAGRSMEIAIVQFDGDRVTDTFTTLIQPGTPVQPYVANLTGISDKMLVGAPTFKEIHGIIDDMTQDRIIVAHNLMFDMQILRSEFHRLDAEFDRDGICTDKLSRHVWPDRKRYNLKSLCESLSIVFDGVHRAENDALATAKLFKHLLRNSNHEVRTKKGASLRKIIAA